MFQERSPTRAKEEDPTSFRDFPPPPSAPGGPSITHYDETTGVPLTREAVASQQSLGHTVVPLSEAYTRRLSRLQVLFMKSITDCFVYASIHYAGNRNCGLTNAERLLMPM